MGEITRYEVFVAGAYGGPYAAAKPAEMGNYVLYSNHEAEVARLRAELQNAAKAALDATALACEKEREADALRANMARYRWLQKQTPYRFGKIQAACVIDAVDTLYFKADEFDRQIDASMEASK